MECLELLNVVSRSTRRKVINIKVDFIITLG